MAPRTTWSSTLVPAVVALALAAGAAEALVVWPKLQPSRLREKQLNEGPFANVQSSANGVPIVDPPTRTAGYFKLDRKHAAEMFYFYFQARTNPTKAPVVLWMTGGPGCSSELAVLYENGPYSLAPDGKSLVETPSGWDVTHNMVFVDQPLGTGYSYTTDPSEDVYGTDGVAEDMLDFLQHFFHAHPELADAPFFITGESYAGHYVPAVSHRVWLSNKNKEGPYINLKGLAIGNGITEPAVQMGAYGDFAALNDLITPSTHSWMKFFYPPCHLAVRWCAKTGWDWLCSLGESYCTATQYSPILTANTDINVYDIRKKCVAPLCYDFSAADTFFNSAPVREALGVPPVAQWSMCNWTVYGHFAGDQLHRFDTLLPELMADDIRVMIYAGDKDLICNYVGNRRWVDALEWEGADDWFEAQDKLWVVEGRTAGAVKQHGPLTYVRVYNAGHMVPMDQPLNSLAMISSFTRNLTLAGRWDLRDVVHGPGAQQQQREGKVVGGADGGKRQGSSSARGSIKKAGGWTLGAWRTLRA